ncbi:MAG TPA: signal peptidase II [Propionibacteriaceae bacterium]|nr:signal peptidase II [Propionibacteriaceae bacterium]
MSGRGAIGHRAARRLIALIAVGGLVLDQVTKAMAVAWLDPMRPPRILGGLVTLQLIRNPGAAFSMGENATVVFSVLAIAMLVFVVFWLAPKVTARAWAVATGLGLAGIAGNLTDRLVRPPSFLHGHVVDFIQLPYFAIVNVADICLTSAAVTVVVLSLFASRRDDKRQADATEETAPLRPDA